MWIVAALTWKRTGPPICKFRWWDKINRVSIPLQHVGISKVASWGNKSNIWSCFLLMRDPRHIPFILLGSWCNIISDCTGCIDSSARVSVRLSFGTIVCAVQMATCSKIGASVLILYGQIPLAEIPGKLARVQAYIHLQCGPKRYSVLGSRLNIWKELRIGMWLLTIKLLLSHQSSHQILILWQKIGLNGGVFAGELNRLFY